MGTGSFMAKCYIENKKEFEFRESDADDSKSDKCKWTKIYDST